MKLAAIRFVLWLVRTLGFELMYWNSFVVLSYRWRDDPCRGFSDWFESPNLAGEIERDSVEAVVGWDGFWLFVWRVFTQSCWPVHGLTRWWKRRPAIEIEPFSFGSDDEFDLFEIRYSPAASSNTSRPEP